MKKNDIIVSSEKSEFSFSEHELLKGVFDALHVSSERIEETIAQVKDRNQQ